ncbi:MAG: cupin domain-containing protein [Gemmatimonadaceae bacterium]|nr:cupin domain-containing protein [Gemmatimonadaceae bacterium]
MPLHRLQDTPVRELAPGLHAQVLHGDALSVMHVRVDAEARLPRHAHPHEQATTVIRGRLLLTVGDEEYDLSPGMTAFIPSGVPHHAYAPESCEVIDLFTPVREDLR